MNHLHFDELDSTNKYIKEHIDELDNMSFVSASYQSAGKGRNERKWVSQKGLNLLFSFCIKNNFLIDHYRELSILSAICICKYLEESNIKNVKIKWPNDVYVNDKKIAGILIEGQIPEFLVVGVGLNVNQTDFNGKYRNTPTSMKIEKKNEMNLSKVLENLFSIFNETFLSFNGFDVTYFEYFNQHDYLSNKEGCVINNGKEERGIFKGIDSDCLLKLKTNSSEIKIFSNEITLK